MAETFEQRFPVDEAVDVIASRLAEGWSLLGVEGLWVEGDSARPDLAWIFDASPDGLRDPEAASAMLASWPGEQSFYVEVLLTR